MSRPYDMLEGDVTVTHEPDCTSQQGYIDGFRTEFALYGNAVTAEQREKLLTINIRRGRTS